MLTDETRRALQVQKVRDHTRSYFLPFRLTFILSPITLRYCSWDIYGGTLAYQDIYIFGFRVIRRQLFWKRS